jgi:hypothetical protein
LLTKWRSNLQYSSHLDLHSEHRGPRQ